MHSISDDDDDGDDDDWEKMTFSENPEGMPARTLKAQETFPGRSTMSSET